MKASGAASARRFCTSAHAYVLGARTTPLHKTFCTIGTRRTGGLTPRRSPM